jgi:hypothetical protein
MNVAPTAFGMPSRKSVLSTQAEHPEACEKIAFVNVQRVTQYAHENNSYTFHKL